MDKRVLLIGEETGFMVNAIVNGLKKEEYEVTVTAANVDEISRVENKPKLLILYMYEKMEDISEMLVYLNDLIVENEIDFFLVGTEEEIELVQKTIPKANVTASFTRPLNVKLLAQTLNKAFDRGTAAEAQKRILIIDDNATTLRTMKSMLQTKYNVFMANSGMNGITFLAKNKVDLVLLDYEMPVTSGPQVLEMLRSEEETRGIPVMFLTAKGDRESVLKVVGLKPEKYLLKSMPPEELIRNIDEFFAQKK